MIKPPEEIKIKCPMPDPLVLEDCFTFVKQLPVLDFLLSSRFPYSSFFPKKEKPLIPMVSRVHFH